VHNRQAGYHFVEVEATLRHGTSKDLMAASCRNVSVRYILVSTLGPQSTVGCEREGKNEAHA
jgi:hypothetical protein